MWIVLALISVVFYAVAEVLQKKGSSIEDENSELKLLVWFGIISVLISLFIYAFGLKESDVTALKMIKNNPLTIISPLLYYLSLLLCFLSFKFIPLSIASPITCADGVLTFTGVIILYLIIGKEALIDESITPLKLVLVISSFIGIYVCGVIQSKKENREENKKLVNRNSVLKSGCFAFMGIALAFLSATFDACSSLTDIYFLTDEFEFFDYIYIHGIMVFVFTLFIYVILILKQKQFYNPFSKTQLPKILGAGCDSLGMVFYMSAVSKNAIYTNVLISSFCILTVIFSRIFLKEKIEKKQGLWIAFTIICIIIFAIVDELF